MAKILKDVNHFVDSLALIYPKAGIITNGKNKAFANDSSCSDQTTHTHDYVEKYKDDNFETLASDVINKVFTYVSKFIEAKDINMNKIGTDLVAFGVKKTRKSKGNVYGIKNPSIAEIARNASAMCGSGLSGLSGLSQMSRTSFAP